MPRGVPSVQTLSKHATTLLRQYVETDAKRTEVLKDLARTVVGIRAQFDNEGRPDWAGTTGPYRECIAKVYENAGIPADSVSGVQAALRYHIGNVVRDVAPAADLKRLGLKDAGPRDRQAARQSTTVATERRDAPQEDISDPLVLIRRALTIVMHAATLPADSDETRQECSILLMSLEHQCQTLREMLNPAPVQTRQRRVKVAA